MNGTYSFSNTVRDLSGALSIVMAKSPKFIRLFSISDPARNTKHEWLDLALAGGAVTATAHDGAGKLTLSAADAAKLKVDTLLSVQGDASVWRVTAVAAEAADIALVHQNGGAYSNISGVSTDGAVFDIISSPAKEGSSAGDDGISQGTAAYNYTQIFRHDINISGSAVATGVYGFENQLNVQTAYKLQLLAYEMNRTAIRGRKQVASAAAPGRTGGLYEFCGSGNSVNASASAFSVDMVNDAAALLVDGGGSPNVVLCSPAQARVLTASLGDKVRVLQGDATRGDYVASIINDLTGVPMTLVADSDIPAADAWVLDATALGIAWLRTLTDRDTTTPGTDGIRRTLLGECAFEFRNPTAKSARIYGLMAAATALANQRAAIQTVSISSSALAPVYITDTTPATTQAVTIISDAANPVYVNDVTPAATT